MLDYIYLVYDNKGNLTTLFFVNVFFSKKKGGSLNKLTKGLLIFVIFSLNTFVIFKYADSTFSLPLWMQQLITQIEEEIDLIANEFNGVEIEPNSESTNTASNVNVAYSEENTSKSRHSEFSVVGGSCAEGRFGLKQQDKPFYVWTDYTGGRHVSDKPPKLDSTVPVSILGHFPPAQFITRFIGKPMNIGFQDKLSRRLVRLSKEYAQVLDVTTVREVRLNFRFFNQQAEFDRHKKRVVPSMPSRTGYYIHASNEMVILVTDEDAGLDTSIHEAVHAINRALFGSMAKWLNEGLAQVLAMNTSGFISEISPLKYNLSKDKLFEATDADWIGPLRSQLYRASKLLIYQLMATDQGRNSIARLLLAEQVNGCNDLSVADVLRILG
jgi:hypothetical protein